MPNEVLMNMNDEDYEALVDEAFECQKAKDAFIKYYSSQFIDYVDNKMIDPNALDADRMKELEQSYIELRPEKFAEFYFERFKTGRAS